MKFFYCARKTHKVSAPNNAPLQFSKQGLVNLHARVEFNLHERELEGDAGSPASQSPS